MPFYVHPPTPWQPWGHLMARDHARLLLSIWEDKDWIALPAQHQVVYLALVSSRDLSWCGVAPFLPKRLAKIAADVTERKARVSLSALCSRSFLIIDEATDEVAVRSYIRHDGIMRQPNVAKAMAKAIDRVHSQAIVDVIVSELAREYGEHDPKKDAGWKAFGELQPELFQQVLSVPYLHPSRKAS